MTNTFSAEQRSETGNLDANLISREYKLNQWVSLGSPNLLIRR